MKKRFTAEIFEHWILSVQQKEYLFFMSKKYHEPCRCKYV